MSLAIQLAHDNQLLAVIGYVANYVNTKTLEKNKAIYKPATEQ